MKRGISVRPADVDADVPRKIEKRKKKELPCLKKTENKNTVHKVKDEFA
jgi:hypothetical protein